MTSTDPTPTLNQADSSPWRALLQLGLGLLCLVLGGLAAVGIYGPSMMGSSLANARFSTLKDRVQGVLEYKQSTLSWMEHGHIQGLRLAGAEPDDVLRGSLYVPSLLDWFGEGLLPGHAHVSLDLLRLTMDPSGRFNLLKNLAARAGVSKDSPFFDRGMLKKRVNYWGSIDKLVFEDQRSAAGPVSWPDSDFRITWKPEGPGHLEFKLGGEQLVADLDWDGMGEDFSIASLRGKVAFDGPSVVLEALLGFPGGIIGSMQGNLRVSLSFEGSQGEQGSSVATRILIADSEIQGRFDGRSFTMSSSGIAPSLGMRRFAGLDTLLDGLTAGLPNSLREKIRLSMQHRGSWTWILKGLQTGITPLDKTLPFLEGLLASSRFELAYELPRGLSLAPQKVTGESLEVGESTLNWAFDPEQGQGQGSLTASTVVAPSVGVANLFLGGNKSLHKGFEMNWTGSSPMPSKGAQLQSAKFSHTPTGFYSSYLPSWGASLPGVLGASCSLDIRRLDPGRAHKKHGGMKPAWKVAVTGAKNAVGEDFVFYVGEGALWMEPNEIKGLQLQPGRHAGVYDMFFSRFLPWFEVLKVNGTGFAGGDLLVEVSDLIFRGKDLNWYLDEGFVELPQVDDVEYRIKRGWEDVWGKDDTLALEPIAFEVAPGRVTFEDLQFPIGTLQGNIDMLNGVVHLKVVEVTPLLALLPDDLQSFAKGVMITGEVHFPKCSKPIVGTGQDS